jgi:hypothetical protein
MANLSTSSRLGNTSTSSLVRSSKSIQSAITANTDEAQRIQFQNNPSSGNLDVYLNYLQSRANQLNSTGSITDSTKAMAVAQSMNSAIATNTSFEVQNTSIQIMEGNATPQDKWNQLSNLAQRASSVGDMKLTQSLVSQADSLSQQIQYQNQQAQLASKTLSTQQSTVQGEIISSLDNSLKQLNNDITNVGRNGLNDVVSKWVDGNRAVLQSFGVIIPDGAQPNYFDLVNGIAAAQYNHYILKAQVEQTYDPYAAQLSTQKAQNILTGVDKFSTITGNDMTVSQLTSAAQNPTQFAYDNTTGKLVQTDQTGYSGYDQNGLPKATYSGQVAQSSNQIYFLNPSQTAELSSMGLNFSVGKPAAGEKTGNANGVQIEATSMTPSWLQKIVGSNGLSNAFVDNSGNLQIKGSSSQGNGQSYYTLVNVGGLSGGFEHLPDGTIKPVGGDYGFNTGAAQLLLNMGAFRQSQLNIDQVGVIAAQQNIGISNTPVNLNMQSPPTIPQPTQPPIQQTKSVQTTANPQTTVNPQGSNISIQGGNINPQLTPSQGGIPLGNSSGWSMKL